LHDSVRIPGPGGSRSTTAREVPGGAGPCCTNRRARKEGCVMITDPKSVRLPPGAYAAP